MYCSIQEAWNLPQQYNNNQNVVEHYPKNNSNNFKQIKSNQTSNNIMPNNIISNNDTKITCENYLDHINNCENCRLIIEKMLSNNSTNIIDKLLSTPEIKETIVVFLIGIVILMILNILYK